MFSDFLAEKERFELSRRDNRPTPLAGAPLRPLEYFSVYSSRSAIASNLRPLYYTCFFEVCQALFSLFIKYFSLCSIIFLFFIPSMQKQRVGAFGFPSAPVSPIHLTSVLCTCVARPFSSTDDVTLGGVVVFPSVRGVATDATAADVLGKYDCVLCIMARASASCWGVPRPKLIAIAVLT